MSPSRRSHPLLNGVLVCTLGALACAAPTPELTVPGDDVLDTQAAFLRVRLHARFVSLEHGEVLVRLDNPTDLAVERARIVVDGRTQAGPWTREAWTGPIDPGARDLPVLLTVPEDAVGGIRVTMVEAEPRPGQVLSAR